MRRFYTHLIHNLPLLASAILPVHLALTSLGGPHVTTGKSQGRTAGLIISYAEGKKDSTLL